MRGYCEALGGCAWRAERIDRTQPEHVNPEASTWAICRWRGKVLRLLQMNLAAGWDCWGTVHDEENHGGKHLLAAVSSALQAPSRRSASCPTRAAWQGSASHLWDASPCHWHRQSGCLLQVFMGDLFVLARNASIESMTALNALWYMVVQALLTKLTSLVYRASKVHFGLTSHSDFGSLWSGRDFFAMWIAYHSTVVEAIVCSWSSLDTVLL